MINMLDDSQESPHRIEESKGSFREEKPSIEGKEVEMKQPTTDIHDVYEDGTQDNVMNSKNEVMNMRVAIENEPVE